MFGIAVVMLALVNSLAFIVKPSGLGYCASICIYGGLLIVWIRTYEGCAYTLIGMIALMCFWPVLCQMYAELSYTGKSGTGAGSPMRIPPEILGQSEWTPISRNEFSKKLHGFGKESGDDLFLPPFEIEPPKTEDLVRARRFTCANKSCSAFGEIIEKQEDRFNKIMPNQRCKRCSDFLEKIDARA